MVREKIIKLATKPNLKVINFIVIILEILIGNPKKVLEISYKYSQKKRELIEADIKLNSVNIDNHHSEIDISNYLKVKILLNYYFSKKISITINLFYYFFSIYLKRIKSSHQINI